MPKTFSITSLTTACLAAACFAPPALAQGTFKPVDAMIVNPSSRPVPVTVISAPMPAGEGSYQTYNFRAGVFFGGNSSHCTSSAQPFLLPAGKRLVLTHLAGIASLPAPAALLYVSVGMIENGEGTGPLITVPAAAPMPLTGGNGMTFNQSAAGQQVHAYIDGAFQLCIGSAASTNNSVFVTLTGYLVPKP